LGDVLLEKGRAGYGHDPTGEMRRNTSGKWTMFVKFRDIEEGSKIEGMVENEIEKELVEKNLKKVGDMVEQAIVGNEVIYMDKATAAFIRENVVADFGVFTSGCVFKREAGEVVVETEEAVTGKVLKARALLLLGALGEERFRKMMAEILKHALITKGGGVSGGENEGEDYSGETEVIMTDNEAVMFADRFLEKGCGKLNFSFGGGENKVEKKILNRLTAQINAMYFILATSGLNDDDREFVQRDLLFSANVRLPILKGYERSRESESRHNVLGFAQAAPIRHLPPGCLGVGLVAIAK
jgi:hypothetical protein